MPCERESLQVLYQTDGYHSWKGSPASYRSYNASPWGSYTGRHIPLRSIRICATLGGRSLSYVCFEPSRRRTFQVLDETDGHRSPSLYQRYDVSSQGSYSGRHIPLWSIIICATLGGRSFGYVCLQDSMRRTSPVLMSTVDHYGWTLPPHTYVITSRHGKVMASATVYLRGRHTI